MDAAGTKTDFGKGWGSVGPFSGIRGFGVATTRADAGGELVVPHEEVTFDGQEESYVGLRGRARFTLGGETVEFGPGDLLHVQAPVIGEAIAMELSDARALHRRHARPAARGAGVTYERDRSRSDATGRCPAVDDASWLTGRRRAYVTSTLAPRADRSTAAPAVIAG